MGKLILVSILFATVVVPAIAAGDRSGRRGLKRTLLLLALFNAAYVALLTLVYARHYMPAR